MASPATDKLLEQLSKMLETAGNATWEQAPLVFKDLLTWGMVEGSAWAIFGLALTAGAWFGLRGWAAEAKDEARWDEMFPGTARQKRQLVRFLIASWGVAITMFHGLSVIQILVTPRAYLLRLLR